MFAPCVATIGFFDGVHLGHRCLIGQVKEEALLRAMRSVLVTFPTHPARVLRPDVPLSLLTTAEEKTQLLQQTGVDSVELMPFTKELAALSAREFMTEVLLRRFNVHVLVIGYDHRFGHNRAEGFEDYVRIGEEIGMEVVQAAELAGGVHVSSSAIRHALANGLIVEANAMLGYEYKLSGTVVHGHHVGTALGFPTANIRPDHPDKLVPMNGVYAVEVIMRNQSASLEEQQNSPCQGFLGMLNIGTRPTFDNGSDRSIEVHIFDFHEDIYEQSVEIRFLRFLRNETKFATTDELRKQLLRDMESAK